MKGNDVNEGPLTQQTHQSTWNMDFQNPALTASVQKYIEELTGKADEESDSSMEEQDSFSFTLTPEEVATIQEREYLDFSSIFRRHQRYHYSWENTEASMSRVSQRLGQDIPGL